LPLPTLSENVFEESPFFSQGWEPGPCFFCLLLA
jgi:hypothetical protein